MSGRLAALAIVVFQVSFAIFAKSCFFICESGEELSSSDSAEAAYLTGDLNSRWI
jgi:hypothetical protein